MSRSSGEKITLEVVPIASDNLRFGEPFTQTFVWAGLASCISWLSERFDELRVAVIEDVDCPSLTR